MLANCMRRLVHRLARNVSGSGALAAIAAIWHGASDAHAQSSLPCRYEVTHIIQAPICPGGPGGGFYPVTVGTAISPNGRYVCGYYYSCGFTTTCAFVYQTQSRQFSTIPLPSGFLESNANDASDSGLIVGRFGGISGEMGFIYNALTSEITLLPPGVPGGTCSATGINSSGVVCGTRTIQASPHRTSAFIWTAKDGFTDLGLIDGQSTSAADINTSGAITGAMKVDGVDRAFLWLDGKLLDGGSLAGLRTSARAINNSHRIVGNSDISGLPPNSIFHAFYAENGSAIDLGTLPGWTRSAALAINDASTIVGICSTQGVNDFEPFVWTQGSMVAINDLLEGNSAGLIVTFLRGISATGAVTGEGYVQSIVSFVLTPRYAPVGDVTQDCQVNVNDLLMVINEWSKTKSVADINNDGIVNHIDLLLVIENWST